MENKEMKKPIPAEIADDTLEPVSGGFSNGDEPIGDEPIWCEPLWDSPTFLMTSDSARAQMVITPN